MKLLTRPRLVSMGVIECRGGCVGKVADVCID